MLALTAVSVHAAEHAAPRVRRVLYNFDGDSCLVTHAGGQGPVEVTADDVRRLIEEVAFDGSQVDTILVCVNAQVMYYPTQVGTMRGALSTPDERAAWPASERQRHANLERFFAAGVDPYAVMLEEAHRRGREALLSFRVNDAHGNDFLRTQFWQDHPEFRLGKGALDFRHAEVREYVLGLIREAVERYDCDGLELDFNRFPTFFGESAAEERIDWMNDFVRQVREMLDGEEVRKGRPLVLGVRVPSDYGRRLPTPEVAREAGCDPAAWAANGWIEFLTVSEFLFERYDIPIAAWREAVAGIPVYGGIECTTGGAKENYLTADDYRRAACKLWDAGAGGVYLFNFFTTREYGAESWEPPFEALRTLGDRLALAERDAAPSDSLIGYTELRTDLPGGRHANVSTMRAMVCRADGTDRRPLAEELLDEPGAWTQFAGWSPDGGTAIVIRGWESEENARWEEEHGQFRYTAGGWLMDTFLVDAATGAAANVTAVERVSDYNTGVFYWPGDATRLGFTALIDGESRPFRMDLDGRNKRDLSGGAPRFAYGFRASPDGARIAYHKDYQVYVENADGSNAVRVETGQPFNFVPQWSPDGAWLVFLSGEHYDCHPTIVPASGSGPRKLADRGGYRGVVEFLDVPDFHGGSSDTPIWSADGWVYYTAKIGESVELMRVSVDGVVERLTESASGTLHYHPTPSPDGTRLAFGSKREGVRELHVLELGTRRTWKITELERGRAAMWPHWQPGAGR